MPTLYVQNVPDDLYNALRKRARLQHRSMAAEVLALLEHNVPTEKQLKRRADLLRKLDRLSASVKRAPGAFPTAEEIVREDRSR